MVFIEIELACRAVVIATFQFVPFAPDDSNAVTPMESSSRSLARALAKRDITVPTGQSITLAIS